jgi:predicted CopG family antitoxin
MASKNISIREDVYERLKAHKRGDESFSDTLERILHGIDSDWRTHVGFLTDEEAADLDAEVERGLDELDGSLDELGTEIDEQFANETS